MYLVRIFTQTGRYRFRYNFKDKEAWAGRRPTETCSSLARAGIPASSQKVVIEVAKIAIKVVLFPGIPKLITLELTRLFREIGDRDRGGPSKEWGGGSHTLSLL